MNARRLFAGLCPSVLFLAATSPALGLANRVFVSARSGNNANSCDNVSTPCQTLQGAVNQLNPGGEAIVLDSGGYGPVTISQSVAIDAAAGITAFIHPPSGDAITITAGASDAVSLRGLTLNGGSGIGVVVNTAGSVHIENCVISGFSGIGIVVQATAPSTSILVTDTIIRQNQRGIRLSGGRGSIDHCRIEVNSVTGVEAVGADFTARDSVLAGNGSDGFFVNAVGTKNTILNVYQCLVTNNGGNGINALNGGTGFVIARAANSSISENFGIGLASGSGVTFESLGNNFARGNIGGETSGTVTVVAPR